MSQPQTPLLTVDVVIQQEGAGEKVVLIKRRNPPFGWALPGGFVDIGEATERAARREAAEETGLDVRLTGILGVYSDPGRDPRGHTVTVAYVGEATGEPRSRSDAADVGVFGLDELPGQIAFDHDRILADFQSYLRGARSVIRFS